MLAVGASGFEASAGVWLLLITPLCWQFSHLVVLRGLVGVPPLILTSARYMYGGVLLAFLWLGFGEPAALANGGELARLVPWLALQGCVLGYGGTLLWYQAITRLDLARTTAIVVPAIPLLSLAASFVLLGEIASARQWAGLALTAVGILVFVTAPHAVYRRVGDTGSDVGGTASDCRPERATTRQRGAAARRHAGRDAGGSIRASDPPDS